MNFLTVGDRQHDAQLAALQLFQSVRLKQPALITPDIVKTMDGDHGTPLSYEETNELCRGIGGGVNCLNDEFVKMIEAFEGLARYLDDHEATAPLAVIEAYNAATVFLNAATVAGLACGELETVETEVAEPAETVGE